MSTIEQTPEIAAADPTRQAASASGAEATELSSAEIDARYPPGSRERASAQIRARLVLGDGFTDFASAVNLLPAEMRASLNDPMTEFLNTWSQSIMEQAKLDKEAALASLIRAQELAASQRARPNVPTQVARELSTIASDLGVLRSELAHEMPDVPSGAPIRIADATRMGPGPSPHQPGGEHGFRLRRG